jgi:hypothetical protein
MSDSIWYLAYEDILSRYKSARSAIKILQAENKKLSIRPPEELDTENKTLKYKIDGMRIRIEEQRAEITRLLARLECRKIRFVSKKEAQDFCDWMIAKGHDTLEPYPCKNSGPTGPHYHTTHKEKWKRGLHRKV